MFENYRLKNIIGQFGGAIQTKVLQCDFLTKGKVYNEKQIKIHTVNKSIYLCLNTFIRRNFYI